MTSNKRSSTTNANSGDKNKAKWIAEVLVKPVN